MRKKTIDIEHEISGWSDSYCRQFIIWLFGKYKFDRADLVEFTKVKRGPKETT